MEIICNKCKKEKNIKEYYKSSHKSHPLGYITPCKNCIKQNQKMNYTGEYHKNRLENLSEEEYKHRSNQLTLNAQKRREDPIVRLKEAVRTRMYNAFKSYQLKKTNHTVEYLGCDMKSYHTYLESQFDNKMNWDNYGTYWEIDHIIPIDLFDLNDNKQLYECFNYKNTRPLFITENRIKSNKII